jgi:hypothetical protein
MRRDLHFIPIENDDDRAPRNGRYRPQAQCSALPVDFHRALPAARIATYYRLYAGGDKDAVCRQIEDASKCIDIMFDRMRAEDDVEKRRQIAGEDGPAIGRLQVAMDIANAMGPEPARDMLRAFSKMSLGRTASEFMSLCNWVHVADAEVKP